MKKTELRRRGMAALLALLLLISLCPAALAAEKGTLSIGTLEELADFADRCASDAYSKDLTVVLTADIDAAGTEMAIPVFSGTFDGQGHRIYNLELTRSASGYGFFGQIQKGAVVRNLSLVGETARRAPRARWAVWPASTTAALKTAAIPAPSSVRTPWAASWAGTKKAAWWRTAPRPA